MQRTYPPEKVLVISLIALLVGTYGLLLLLPGESYGKTGTVQTITINTWRGWLLIAALASSIVAVFASLRTTRLRWWPAWLLFALGLGSPLIWFGCLVHDFGAHQGAGFVRDHDGKEYHLLKSSFLQGSHLAIGRLRHRLGPIEEYEILAESPWEESFGFLAVVRPEASTNPELYLTDDRMLVGVPHRNMAFLAYDLRAAKAYSQRINGDESGFSDMRELSPFLLLRSHDVPRPSDFQSLMAPESFGRPYPQAIQKDLTSDNARVRELARRFLAVPRTRSAEAAAKG
jgi:hypothetical protein